MPSVTQNSGAFSGTIANATMNTSERRARPPGFHSSSSWCVVVRLRHSSTGMISVKTMTSLNALAQNDENDSMRPTKSAPAAAIG